MNCLEGVISTFVSAKKNLTVARFVLQLSDKLFLPYKAVMLISDDAEDYLKFDSKTCFKQVKSITCFAKYGNIVGEIVAGAYKC